MSLITYWTTVIFRSIKLKFVMVTVHWLIFHSSDIIDTHFIYFLTSNPLHPLCFNQILWLYSICILKFSLWFLGIELVNPKMRPLAATIIGVFYPIGAMIMGCVYWYFQDWRKLLLICYTPGLLFILYFWFVNLT